jgi:aminotransferase
MRVASAVERVGTLAAAEVGARSGVQRLDLYGAPSPPIPPHVREAVLAAADRDARAPSRGDADLRAAAGRWVESALGRSYDPDREILVTNGGMQALSVCFQALLDPGDAVVIPSPSFFFGNLVSMAGAESVYVPSFEGDGWRWDLERLAEAIDSRTRLIVACNPCNPTGYLPSLEDLRRLAELAVRHDVLVLADESYERVVYDGRRISSLASLPEIADRLVLVRSVSKSFGMPGWRIGFVFAPRAILERCLAIFEWTSLRCSVVTQRAAWAALEGPHDWLAGVTEQYQRNRHLAYSAVNATQRLSCRLPESCPFLFVNVANLHGSSAAEREDRLLEMGIPIVPGRHFMAPDYVRLPFGGEPHTLDLLARRMAAL